MSREERESWDLINNLNNDCLSKIFTYLSLDERFNIQAVCKRWNSDLAWGGITSLDFTHQDLSKFASRGDKGVERILKKCGNSLQELNLGYVGTSKTLPIVSRYCHNLMELKMRLQCGDRGHVKWFPQMEKLQYFEMLGHSRHLSEHFIEILPKNLSGLHLTLCGPRYDFSGASVETLENLIGLSALTLEGSFSLKIDIMRMISQMSYLTFLSLADCTVTETFPHMDRLTNLEHLNVTRIPQINNRFIIEISKYCKNLKVLKLNSCFKVSDIGIVKLQTLPRLQKLLVNNVCKITDVSLSGLHSLEILACKECHEVKSTGIIALINNAPNLKYLNVRYTAVNSNLLTEASKIIRRRISNIALRIDIHRSVARRWNIGDCPPLLNVKIN